MTEQCRENCSRIVIIILMLQEKKDKGTAPFVFKLYQLLEEPGNQQLAAWTHEPNTFTIFNVGAFCRQLLPKYYKHSNFSSFIRQLNIYNFTKTKIDSTEHTYFHPHFGKGQKHKLRFIKRKSSQQRQNEESQVLDRVEDGQKKAEMVSSNESSNKGAKKILDEEVQYQEEKNYILTQENQCILRNSCDLIIQLLQRIHHPSNTNFKSIRSKLERALVQSKPTSQICNQLQHQEGFIFASGEYQQLEPIQKSSLHNRKTQKSLQCLKSKEDLDILEDQGNLQMEEECDELDNLMEESFSGIDFFGEKNKEGECDDNLQ